MTGRRVLIVGGGLVGLSGAAFLAHHGVPVTVVERHPGLSDVPRLRLLNGRSMELYRAIGLEDDIRRHPSRLAELNRMARAETVAGRKIAETDLEGLAAEADLSPTGHAPIDQHRLEPLLLTAAERAGAQIRYSTELVSFTQDDDGITVRLQGTGPAPASAQERYAYLLGCDGHRSTVRELLGIGTERLGEVLEYLTIALNTDLEPYVRDRRVGVWLLDQPTPGTVLLPHDHPGRWILMIPYRSADGAQLLPGVLGVEDCTPQMCVSLARTAIGVPGHPLEPAPPILGGEPRPLGWTFGAVGAKSYGGGRVFLAGDAAQLIPPSGGFGANAGIAAVHNLAWKLALVLRGRAASDLLATYEQERRPIGIATAEAALERMALRTAADSADPVGVEGNLGVVYGPVHRSHAVLPDAVTGPPESRGAAPAFIDPRRSRGLPGTRAPQVGVVRAGERVSAIDLFGSGFVLLHGDSGTVWADAASRAAHRLGVTVDAHRVEDPDWPDAYGIGPGGAALVRPDGIVGWRTPETARAPEQALLQALASILRPGGADTTAPRPAPPDDTLDAKDSA